MSNKIYLIGLLLFSFGCKKVPLPSEEGNPVFMVDAVFQETNIVFEAGREHFYQYSNVYLDTNDIFVYQSLLKKDPLCIDNCNESLLIEIRDTKVSNGQAPFFEEALVVGNYQFAQANDTLNTATQYMFEAQTIGTNQVLSSDYVWNFSPNVETTGLDLTQQQLTIQRTDNSPFSVALQVVDAFGAEGSKQVEFLADGSAMAISMAIKGNAISPILTVEADEWSNPISTFVWSDGEVAAELFLESEHPYGKYCVTGKSAMGVETTTCGEYGDFFNQNIFCTAQIDWTKEEVVLLEDLWLSKIILVYTDPQGTKWTSFGATQSNSYFNIMNVSDFEINEKGQRTKIIKADFSVFLTNGNMEKKMVGQVILGVSVSE